MVTATGPAPGSEMTTSVESTDDRSTAGVLHVAAIFASHMVLQRNKPSPCSARWMPIALDLRFPRKSAISMVP